MNRLSGWIGQDDRSFRPSPNPVSFGPSIGDAARIGDEIVVQAWAQDPQGGGYVTNRWGLSNVPQSADYVVARVDSSDPAFLRATATGYISPQVSAELPARLIRVRLGSGERTGLAAYRSEVAAVARNGQIIAGPTSFQTIFQTPLSPTTAAGSIFAPVPGQSAGAAAARSVFSRPIGRTTPRPTGPVTVARLQAALDAANAAHLPANIIASLRQQLATAQAAATGSAIHGIGQISVPVAQTFSSDRANQLDACNFWYARSGFPNLFARAEVNALDPALLPDIDTAIRYMSSFAYPCPQTDGLQALRNQVASVQGSPGALFGPQQTQPQQPEQAPQPQQSSDGGFPSSGSPSTQAPTQAPTQSSSTQPSPSSFFSRRHAGQSRSQASSAPGGAVVTPASASPLNLPPGAILPGLPGARERGGGTPPAATLQTLRRLAAIRGWVGQQPQQYAKVDKLVVPSDIASSFHVGPPKKLGRQTPRQPPVPGQSDVSRLRNAYHAAVQANLPANIQRSLYDQLSRAESAAGLAGPVQWFKGDKLVISGRIGQAFARGPTGPSGPFHRLGRQTPRPPPVPGQSQVSRLRAAYQAAVQKNVPLHIRSQLWDQLARAEQQAARGIPT
jgi:hypothetical protein